MNLNKTNSILKGTDDSGRISPIPVDDKGHLEVALHEPRLPFGSVHTENLLPILQYDGVYGLNPYNQIQTTGHLTGGVSSASVTNVNNISTCATGTTALSFSSLQSRERLRYRPGQGITGRYTAIFSEPAANSILVAGFGTSEAGLFFGYNGTSFGILHSTDGDREIQTLTVTTGATVAANVTITLNGIAHNVAVTNSSDVNQTAYEIATATYTGWQANQRGDEVVFLKNAVGDGGTVSFAAGSTGSAASFAETLAGSAATDTWITQDNWNGDKLDGTGPSGVTLDPQNGNVYQIDIQYLGFGGIVFKVEVSVNGNNPTFVTAHTLNYPNTSTTTSISQPSFPFTMAAYSSGSTTNVSVGTASYAGLLEGQKILNGPRLSYTGTKATSTTVQPIATIRNDLVFKGRANQSIINILDINFTARSGNNTYTTLYIYKNATLTGTPVFSEHSTSGCAYVDTSASGATISDNDQLLWSASIMELGTIQEQFPDDILLQPGETLTFAVATSSGTGFATVSMNTREDH